MTVPNLSESDQRKIDSGDYVIDPVFGVQPKIPEIQRRDFEAAQREGDVADDPQRQAAVSQPASPAPAVPVRAEKVNPTP